MSPERIRIRDTKNVIDRLSHASQVAQTPDGTSLCAATALTAVFGADAYAPSRLFTEQSLSVNEKAIEDAVEAMGAWLYEPRTTHHALTLLDHPFTLGALTIQTIRHAESNEQPLVIPHVAAIVPSEIKDSKGLPKTYYLVDTKFHQPIRPLLLHEAMIALTEAECCFIITRSPIPETLQELLGY